MDRAIHAVSVMVELSFFGSWSDGTCFANNTAANFGNRCVSARSYQRQQRRAIGGAFLCFQSDDGFLQNRGQHLAPERALAASARNAHRVNSDAKLLDDIETVALAV